MSKRERECGNRDTSLDTYRVLSEIPHWPNDTFPIKTIEAVSLISDPEGQDLVIRALQNGRSSQIIGVVRRSLEDGLVYKNGGSFARCVRGAFFEEVSVQYALAKVSVREILLPMHEIFNAFSATFPDRKPLVDRFGLNRGINGVFIPDAIIVEVARNALVIRAFCEFSMDSRSLGEKTELYRSGKKRKGFRVSSHSERRELLKINLSSLIRRQHQDLPARVLFSSQLEIFCVGPKVLDNGNGHNATGRAIIECAPITHDEFHRVVDGIIGDIGEGLPVGWK